MSAKCYRLDPAEPCEPDDCACTGRRAALCWYGDCEAELIWADGIWLCPHNHPLRQYEHLSSRTRDRIEYTQTDPTMHRRFFGDH